MMCGCTSTVQMPPKSSHKVLLNPLAIVGWTFRRHQADTIRLYDALSDVMSLATGGGSLNFGLWTDSCTQPLLAQETMARRFGDLANLHSAQTVADIGCGRAGPASVWRRAYPNAQVIGIDLNHRGLKIADSLSCAVNATSTKLPLADCSMDRVLALESAQHFRPLSEFTIEAARVLKPDGILCMALPIAGPRYALHRLGLLWLTWSSEHYTLQTIHDSIESAGLQILDESLVGGFVYTPLAEYYIKNRDVLKKRITSAYPRYVETLLYHSMLDMKCASESGIIDYVLVCSGVD